MDLAATRLVVLAACGSGAGYSSRREGILSLARPFLAAGVPAVVATLWDLQDDVGLALVTAFHREYRATGNPIRSLRAAQLALLGHHDPAMRDPSAWAGVTVASGVPHAGLTTSAKHRDGYGDH
jgi:CHAT domain-containing protein